VIKLDGLLDQAKLNRNAISGSYS